MRACVGAPADLGSRVEDDEVRLAPSCDHAVDVEAPVLCSVLSNALSVGGREVEKIRILAKVRP
jgi:hypothetical protein